MSIGCIGECPSCSPPLIEPTTWLYYVMLFSAGIAIIVGMLLNQHVNKKMKIDEENTGNVKKMHVLSFILMIGGASLGVMFIMLFTSLCVA
jgi:hypothetical protein